jgi:hypothetical protein
LLEADRFIAIEISFPESTSGPPTTDVTEPRRFMQPRLLLN